MFTCKQFTVEQNKNVFPVTTDALLLGASARLGPAEKVLEVGTGTGMISLMSAQRFPGVNITALDIDDHAINLAAHNFSKSPFAPRLNVLLKDYRECVFHHEFDAVISNPPYFETGLASTTHKNAKHQLTLSQEVLIAKSALALKPEGKLHLILPASHVKNVHSICAAFNLHNSRIIKIQSHPDSPAKRVILEYVFNRNFPFEETTFTIRLKNGDFTREYEQLMKAFHPFL